ncbi:splicing factor Cactin-like [Arvicanthis niloticus]|uniref:splicing factor Cactin-like n=1 Tax=Arvicanthis niloticus TaxID=61156 RepID=UPI00402B7CA1
MSESPNPDRTDFPNKPEVSTPLCNSWPRESSWGCFQEFAMVCNSLQEFGREKEVQHFKTWEEQEDSFHLQQAKLCSKIRIRNGRAKPIDLLAKYISAEEDNLAVEMHEPYTFLHGLTVADMEGLLEDIQVYMKLEQGKNLDFWQDMTTITEVDVSAWQTEMANPIPDFPCGTAAVPRYSESTLRTTPFIPDPHVPLPVLPVALTSHPEGKHPL